MNEELEEINKLKKEIKDTRDDNHKLGKELWDFKSSLNHIKNDTINNSFKIKQIKNDIRIINITNVITGVSMVALVLLKFRFRV